MHSLEKIEVNPRKGVHRSTIIWLHGLGADAHDFEDMPELLNLPDALGARFVFPNAPIQPVALLDGQSARAWFNIFDIGERVKQDEAGIRQGDHLLQALIEKELACGIPSTSIVLVGFSQGGAMALHAGLRYPQPLAGIVGLSTYLPMMNTVHREATSENQQTPIFLFHGSYDPLVLLEFGTKSRDVLLNLGYPVTWYEYPIVHEISLEEIQKISEVLVGLLAPQ